jgi:hypothetical protein
MTPRASFSIQPLSSVTIGAFEDLGYTVDYSKADNYMKDHITRTCMCTGTSSLIDNDPIAIHPANDTATLDNRLSVFGFRIAQHFGQNILQQEALENEVHMRVHTPKVDDEFIFVGDNGVSV